MVTEVDLSDGERPIRVDVEFLAPSDVKMQKNHPKLIDDFRVLQFPACAAAFKMPVDTKIVGQTTSGAMNNVQLRVVSLSDFMIMKAHAIGGRDKPKDVYDLCHCLDVYPGGIMALGDEWRRQRGDPLTDQGLFAVSGGLTREIKFARHQIDDAGEVAERRYPRALAFAAVPDC